MVIYFRCVIPTRVSKKVLRSKDSEKTKKAVERFVFKKLISYMRDGHVYDRHIILESEKEGSSGVNMEFRMFASKSVKRRKRKK